MATTLTIIEALIFLLGFVTGFIVGKLFAAYMLLSAKKKAKSGKSVEAASYDPEKPGVNPPHP